MDLKFEPEFSERSRSHCNYQVFHGKESSGLLFLPMKITVEFDNGKSMSLSTDLSPEFEDIYSELFDTPANKNEDALREFLLRILIKKNKFTYSDVY